MKNVLWFIGTLTLIAGLLLAAYTWSEGRGVLEPGPIYLLSAVYLISGLVTASIFFGIVVVIHKLEAIEAKLDSRR